jgi:hypothetical protein
MVLARDKRESTARLGADARQRAAQWPVAAGHRLRQEAAEGRRLAPARTCGCLRSAQRLMHEASAEEASRTDVH